MTCVIGLFDSKRRNFYIGADSVESTQSHLINRNDSKVFIKENGTDSFIFGCSTSFRMIQLLRYSLIIPDFTFNNDEESVDKYMCTLFIESVRKLFKEKGFSSNESNVETGGSFIVGFKKYLYEIQPDYQVAKPRDNFCCIGSGYLSAYGAMTALEQQSMRSEEKIMRALEISAKYNPFVRGPFSVVWLHCPVLA